MTDRALGLNLSNSWLGVVTSVDDPQKSGRVQVRVHGLHDDKSKIPDKQLPWAKTVVPAGGGFGTSLGGKGGSPVGVVVGTTVAGVFADNDKTILLCMWSLPKAGDPKQGKTSNGQPELDTSKGDLPNGAREEDKNAALGKKNIIAEVGNAGAISRTLSAGVGHLADASPGVIIKMLNSDPSNASGFLKGALTGVMGLQNIVGAISPRGIAALAGSAMQGGLQGLMSQFGTGAVLGALKGAIAGGGLSAIAQSSLNVALGGMLNGTPPAYLAAQARTQAAYGALSVSRDVGGAVYGAVGGGIPGQILGSAASSAVASKLLGGGPTTALLAKGISTSTLLQATAGASLASGMISAFAGGGLNAGALTGVLNNVAGGALNAGLNAVLGGGLGNLVGMASKLLGQGIGGMIQGAISNVTRTVADVGKVTDAVTNATKEQAIAKVKKAKAKEAAAPADEPGFTGASGDILQKALQAGSDETNKLIQDRPGQTGNAATDVGSVFG